MALFLRAFGLTRYLTLAAVAALLLGPGCGGATGAGKVSEQAAASIYSGCTSVAAAGPYQVTVGFDFPPDAVQITVLRDDTVIYTSSDHDGQSTIDAGDGGKGLTVGTTYTYKCTIQLATGETIIGTNPAQATITDPLAGFTGCLTGSANTDQVSATVTFQFPAAASQIIVTQNGASIYSSSDHTVTTATPKDLVAGKLYIYTCTVQLDGVLHDGSQQVTVNIPDPLSNSFRGCTAVTAKDATDIEVDYEFPPGVDSLQITRNGIQVFTTTTAKAGAYQDKGLTSGAQYTYACLATKGTQSKTGSNVVTINALTLPVLSYEKSKGNATLVNQATTIVPSTLDNEGLAITGCTLKPGTPTLPPGMTLDPANCTIAGTPTETLDQTTFTVNVTTAAGTSVDASVTLAVAAGAPTLSYNGATGTKGVVGTAMTIAPPAGGLVENGSPITGCDWSGASPGGLLVNANTCVISGTPTTQQCNMDNTKTPPTCTNPVSFGVIATNQLGYSSQVADVALTINTP